MNECGQTQARRLIESREQTWSTHVTSCCMSWETASTRKPAY